MAANRLRGLPGQSDLRTRCNIPNWFNYPNNFTIHGDRILTRSCNEVICIGRTGRGFSEAERARIAPDLAGRPAAAAVRAGFTAAMQTAVVMEDLDG